MSDPDGPSMSVVIVTPDCYETIRRTIRHVAAQTIASRLELIIVAPSRRDLGLVEDDVKGFHSCRVVEVCEVRAMSAARATGIREATAPVVTLAEDHCYPEPGWAEAILKAHEQPWAGVAPAMTNANPQSVTSWVQLFMTYGRWVEPKAAGAISDIPGHNGAYKRSVLMEYGPRLAAMLEVEPLMHRDLQAQGHRLCIEPAAVVRHLNITRLRPLFIDHFYFGRKFAAGRAEAWSWARRALYAAAVPAILATYLRDHLREMHRAGRLGQFIPRGLPILFFCLAARGAGEFLGFALGAGAANKRAIDLEIRRELCISEPDRLGLANS
jgi:hypothetical protein